MHPRAAGIYARISEDRDGAMLGVRRQLQDCGEYAAQKGWPVLDRYVDDDLSAYRGKPRPEYRRMLSDLRDGRIDAVIVWHLDRLHRHPKELEQFFEVCERAKVRHLATVTGDVDLATHDGQFHARILSAVARKESDDKSRRNARKHLEIAQAGRWSGGHPPYGYDRELRIIPEQAAVVREAAQRILAGETLTGICRDFNERRIPTARGSQWSHTTLRQMLVRPSLAGQRTLKGEIVAPGLWEPILGEQDAKRLRALLLDPSRKTHRSARRYLLSSLLTCGLCGAKMVARPNHSRPAYVCAKGPGLPGCGGLTIAAERLEAFLTEAVLYRLDGPELVAALKHQPAADQEAAELEVAIAEDEAQLEEVAGLYGSKQISLHEFLAARKPIQDRLAALTARFSRVDRHSAIRRIAGKADELRRSWPDLNLDQRRAVITAVLDRVIVSRAMPGSNRFDPRRLQPVWRA